MANYGTPKVFNVTFEKGNSHNINVFNSSWKNNNSYTTFDPVAILGKVKLSLAQNIRCCVYKAEFKINGERFAYLSFEGGNVLWVAYDGLPFGSGYVGNFDGAWLQLNGNQKLMDGNPYFWNKATSYNKKYESAGTKTLTVDIYYSVGAELNTNDSQAIIETQVVGTISVLNPILSDLSVSGATISFYKNGTFNSNGLSVKGIFNYRVEDQEAYTNDVTNLATITKPSMTTTGNQAVGVSYSGKTVYYYIHVYGIKTYTTPTIKSTFKKDEGITSPVSKITYDDGTTENVTCQVNASTSTAGSRNASYSVVASKTGETKTWASSYNVYDVAFFTINADSCQKNFDYDEDFTSEGLVITAHYGSNDEAGTTSTPLLTVGYDAIPQDWSVGKDKVVEVTYQGKSEKYLININGIAEVDFDITDCSLYYNGGFRVAKNGLFTTAGKTCNVRRYTNGVLGGYETFLGTITQSNVQTSEVGTKSVTFTITEHGVTLSKTYDVEIYSYDSLEVKNAPKNLFIKEGVYPTLTLGNMEVVAKTSDGLTKTLSYANGEFTLTPAVGTELKKNTTVQVSADYGVSASFVVNVQDNAPASDATITVTGSLVKKFYDLNETISLEGLTVKVSKMIGGETDYEIDDFNAVISGKDNLMFEEGDSNGYHDLVISVDGLEDSVTLEDEVCLDTVSSVTNLSCTRVYKSGEAFDISTVRGKINYLSGNSIDITVNDIQTANTIMSYGDSSISLVIAGKTVSCPVTVIKVASLVATLKTGKANDYDYGAKFDKSRYDYKVIYSDGTTQKALSEDIISCSNDDLIPTSNTSNTISFDVSYTEDEYKVTQTLTLNIKIIKSIKLLDPLGNVVSSCIANGSTYDYVYGKFALDYGERFILDNYIIFITYTDSTTHQIVIDSDTVIQHTDGNINRLQIKNKIENAYVSGSVGKQSIKCYFDIHCHYLSAIDVDFDSVDETHYVYDTLDLSGITAERVISSTDEDDDSYPQTEDITEDLRFAFNGTTVGLNNFKLPSAGTFSLVASYEYNGQTQTDSISVLVESVTLQSIELVTNGAFKPLANYIEGQNLTLEGLKVVIHYNKSSSDREILFSDPSVELVDSDGEMFSKSKLISILDNNVNLFIRYTESGVTKVAELGTLTVIAKVLTGISVVQQPTKVSFTYGDIFNITGAIIKATFNNGDETLVNLADEDLTVSGVEIGHEFNPTDDTVFDDIEITLSYEYVGVTKTATIEISLDKPVIDHLITNINNSLQPIQLQFKDQAVFSMSGLVLKAVMKNGYVATLGSFTSDAEDVLNLDGQNKICVSGAYGYKTITLTGTNPYDLTDTATTTYQIEVVSSGQIVSAFLKLDEGYNFYLVGDTFNAKGVSFQVTDIDGNTWNAKNIVCEPAIGTLLRSAQKINVKVSYTNGEYVKNESFDIIVSVEGTVDFTETNNYKLAVGRSNGVLFTELTHEETTIQFGKVYQDGKLVGEFYPVFREELVAVDENPLHEDTLGFNVYTGNDPVHDCVGYIDIGIDEVRNAHLILFDDPINPIEGQSNIEVTFPHYVEGNADKVNKATFGIIYNNRLFVSGNADFKNMDWHSSETNNDLNEFTYFSDLDYCKYGSDFIAVIGYDIYRDGDLLAIKEGSRNEATLYRRETKLVQATNYSGQVAGDGTLVEEAYPCYPINNNGGEGGISNKTVVNFVGETLVLTRTGLKAITAKDNVNGNEKYTVNVSSFINAKITYEELENAHLYAYKEMLFLKTKRGVYVGYNNLRNDDNEYEWYFLDNIDADIFFELEGMLYFGNSKGEIQRFIAEKEDPKDNEYVDKERMFVGLGGATLNVDEVLNKVILNGNYSDLVKENDSFHLITDYIVNGAVKESLMYALLGLFINDNTRNSLLNDPTFDPTLYAGIINLDTNTFEVKPYANGIDVDEDRILVLKKLFYEGREVYLDQFDGDGYQASVNTAYYLKKYDPTNALDLRYKIVDDYGNEADLTGIRTVRMSFIVNDLAITRITNIEPYVGGGIQFNLIGDHDELLDLISYNGMSEQGYKGVITKEKAIIAYYITIPFTCGTIALSKTIWQWVIANDTHLASYMDIGYISSRKQGDYDLTIKSARGSKQLNFGNLSLDKLQFTSDKLPHIYTKYRVLPNVGFVRFLFRNNEASNMVLTTLQLVYTLSQFTKGER